MRIGELPLNLQVKLLNLIQDKSISKGWGGTEIYLLIQGL